LTSLGRKEGNESALVSATTLNMGNGTENRATIFCEWNYCKLV